MALFLIDGSVAVGAAFSVRYIFLSEREHLGLSVMGKSAPRAHLAYSGASTWALSPYATTASVSFGQGKVLEHGFASPTLSSGYLHAYYRDDPPKGAVLETSTEGKLPRPHTATLEEAGFQYDKYAPKDTVPLKSCIKRGELKEPRFYPFKMNAVLGAHALVSPPLSRAEEAYQRFEAPPYTATGYGQISENATIMLQKGQKPATGYSIGNSGGRAVKATIEAKQGQLEFREPALTMKQRDRVEQDSTRRYFHARDHYEHPFLTSSQYYQNDCLSAYTQMRARGEGLTIAPTLRPLTQFAAQKGPVPYDVAPYAFDVDSSWMVPMRDQPEPPPVHSMAAAAATTTANASPTDRKLPTGFVRQKLLTTQRELEPEIGDGFVTIPERFRRERERRDYLKWGANDDNMYASIQRSEMIKPSSQVPLGGPIHREGRVVATDSSGYMHQVLKSPIIGGMG